MFIELNNQDANHLATGKLQRDNIKTPFKYETLKKSRRYSKEDPMDGFMSMKSNVSIKTNTELNFVKGDKVYLQEHDHYLRVVNFTKDIDEKQYMFLNNATKITYTLDLE